MGQDHNAIADWALNVARATYTEEGVGGKGRQQRVVIGGLFKFFNVAQQDLAAGATLRFALNEDWALNCIKVENDIETMPKAVRRDVMLTSQSLGSAFFTSSKSLNNDANFNQKEKALMQLSKDLAEQRLVLTGRVRSSYLFLETATFTSVLIGMITTILVSVSSTEFGRGDGRSQRLIRVLAITFPALGTATAALIGFYSPQAEWAQASRTLAAETQLHGQIALGVWKLPCPKTDTDDSARPLADALDEWTKRYVDIHTISTASGAQGGGSNPPGGTPGGNPPGGTPGGNPPGGTPGGNPTAGTPGGNLPR